MEKKPAKGREFMEADPMQAIASMKRMQMEAGDTSGAKAFKEGAKSKYGEVPANVTGRVINSELSNISIEVLRATRADFMTGRRVGTVPVLYQISRFWGSSKPTFARKYSSERSRRDLHNPFLCTVL